MPTKSSARWIADGDNMVKALAGQGLQDRPAVRRQRHPEPARADREHDHQGREGPGDRRDRRHDAVGRAAEGRRRRHQGHLLRPPDPRLARTSTTTPPSTTSRSACCRRPRSSTASASTHGKRPVQHRAVRRLARRQQRLLLLQRRDVGPAAPDRQAARSSSQSKQMGMDKVATLRWDAATAQARMENLLSAPTTPSKQVDAVLSPYDGISHRHHLGAEGRRLRHRRTSRCRSSPARTPRSRRSSRSSRTSSTRPIFKDTRDLAKVAADMVDAVLDGQASRRSTTPRPTTTASRSFRPTCSKPVAVDADNCKKALVDTGYYKADQLK